jgi:hypothetical protein
VKRRSLALAVGLAILAAGLLVGLALGAEPSAVPSAVPALRLGSGDLRSEGAGPGLVGNPLLILAAVVALGVATALITLLVARLAQRR